MGDYIKQIEEQNEQLKELLAKSQQELLDTNNKLEILAPTWKAITGSKFEYGAYMSLIGEVFYEEKSMKWFYKFNKSSTDWDDRHGGPFDECAAAQWAMEKKYWGLVCLSECMKSAFQK